MCFLRLLEITRNYETRADGVRRNTQRRDVRGRKLMTVGSQLRLCVTGPMETASTAIDHCSWRRREVG